MIEKPTAHEALAAPRSTTGDSAMPFSNMLLDEADWQDIAVRLSLSQRELQLVQFVCAEYNEESIADQLGISIHTVHTYFGRLFRKLGVHTRCGVLVRVFATHLAMRRNAAPVNVA